MKIALTLPAGRGNCYTDIAECVELELPCDVDKVHRYVKTDLKVEHRGEWWTLFKPKPSDACTSGDFDPNDFAPYQYEDE